MSHKHRGTHKHKETNNKNYYYNNPTVEIRQFFRLQVDSPSKKVQVFFVILLLPPHTVNMTFSPSLLTNGRQLESSEQVIYN